MTLKKVYFAPLEGITDAHYRRLHAKYFGGVDRYYAPFLSPTSDGFFSKRDVNEILPENNCGYTLIPQLMANSPENFLWAADYLSGLGYSEINLNTGCPSGTVVAKKKGAGMLADLDALDRFLCRIFSDTKVSISVKTRIGLTSGDEFPAILEIFNRYPICELTVHARTRVQMYSGKIQEELFAYAYRNSKNPLCFNGDIKSVSDIERISDTYPEINSVMIGRGLVTYPGMLSGVRDKKTIKAFTDELTDGYMQIWKSERNVLARMKEVFGMMLKSFSDTTGRYAKAVGKASTLAEFNSAVMSALTDLKQI